MVGNCSSDSDIHCHLCCPSSVVIKGDCIEDKGATMLEGPLRAASSAARKKEPCQGTQRGCAGPGLEPQLGLGPDSDCATHVPNLPCTLTCLAEDSFPGQEMGPQLPPANMRDLAWRVVLVSPPSPLLMPQCGWAWQWAQDVGTWATLTLCWC